MARSPKSTLLIAHTIAWSGAVLCSLIATYGPHGPARHPKMLLICLLPLAVLALVGLRSKGSGRNAIVVHSILWVIAGVTAFVLANTSLGVGVPPLATTIVLLVLGAASLGILWITKIDPAEAKQETPAD